MYYLLVLIKNAIYVYSQIFLFLHNPVKYKIIALFSQEKIKGISCNERSLFTCNVITYRALITSYFILR